MINQLFLYFYCLPLWATFLYLILFLLLIRIIVNRLEETKHGGKWIRLACGTGCIVWIAAIYYLTVFSRQAGDVGVSYIPFHFLYEVHQGGNPEYIRSAWMNVLLFVPVGVCGYYIRTAGKRNWQWILRLVVVGCLLSVGIEVMQGMYSLGYVEVDDVICNTLGVYVGAMSQSGIFTAFRGKYNRK